MPNGVSTDHECVCCFLTLTFMAAIRFVVVMDATFLRMLKYLIPNQDPSIRPRPIAMLLYFAYFPPLDSAGCSTVWCLCLDRWSRIYLQKPCCSLTGVPCVRSLFVYLRDYLTLARIESLSLIGRLSFQTSYANNIHRLQIWLHDINRQAATKRSSCLDFNFKSGK